jgi:predicted amidophosphoribosyltransferase
VSVKDWILDGLFPPTCIGCDADGIWLCDDCLKAIDLRAQASCPQCGHFPWSNHPCEGEWEFASFISLGSYADPILQKLLRSYKYHRAQCLEPVFPLLLKRFRWQFKEIWPWPEREAIVTSLPMDANRLRERGLDHAALLTDAVQSVLLPRGTRRVVLQRVRQVVPNASLDDTSLRAANMQGVFGVTEKISLPVILVDDVCTTGATAREAARILLAQGVPEVHLFTFASGVKMKKEPDSV